MSFAINEHGIKREHSISVFPTTETKNDDIVADINRIAKLFGAYYKSHSWNGCSMISFDSDDIMQIKKITNAIINLGNVRKINFSIFVNQSEDNKLIQASFKLPGKLEETKGQKQ